MTREEPDGSTTTFGFAISDDGVNAYIPRNVVIAKGMKEEDEGAGFTAPTRPAPETPKAGYDQIMLPLTWDGEPELFTPDEAPAYDGDKEIMDVVDKMDELIGAIKAKEDKPLREMLTLFDDVQKAADWLEENFPPAN